MHRSNERRAIQALNEVSSFENTNWAFAKPMKRVATEENHSIGYRQRSSKQSLHKLTNQNPYKPKQSILLPIQDIRIDYIKEERKLPPVIIPPKHNKPQTAKAQYDGHILGINFAAFEKRMRRKLSGKENF